MSSSSNIKYYGKTESLPKQIELKVGNLSVIYESGNLRYLKRNGIEIIRMIYAAVRDSAWLTATPEISNQVIEEKPESFFISYECRYRLNDIDFYAKFKINGNAGGIITFEMEGKALSTFKKNRIGFCVLHPIEGCAGVPCQIIHSDGSAEIKSFPEYINPGNPFIDVRSMEWRIKDVGSATLNFYGDVFETEDHRNWTDASFKTYCTPLENPYPVEIKKGELIKQKIELKITGNKTVQIQNEDLLPVKITFDLNKIKSLPSFGIGKSTSDAVLAKEDAQILRKLKFDHYRADIYLFSAEWKKNYKIAANESEQLNCPLELALFFGDNPQSEAEQFFDIYVKTFVPVKSIFLFHKKIQSTTNELIESLSELFRQKMPDTELYAGTNCNFAQLNRSRPDTSLIDGLVFSIHPQEHASDNLTLVENLQAQAYTVESAKQFAEGKKIAVSPVTIQRRFNANTDNYETPSTGGEMPWQVDQRQMSLFGASWTAISLKYLSQSGVSSVTYYETAGERGIMMGQKRSRWTKNFVADENTFFPLFHIFAFLTGYPRAKIIYSQSAKPLKVDSLVLKEKNQLYIILANLNHLEETVLIPGLTENSKILLLDEKSYDVAIQNNNWLKEVDWQEKKPDLNGLEIDLKPYATAFIKCGE